MTEVRGQKGVRICSFRAGVGRVNSWLPMLLAFALPLSTSAVSVVAILILLLWLVEGRFSEKCVEIFSNPVAVAVLGFFAVFCLGLLWTDDFTAGLEVIREQWKIALLPVILTATGCQRRSLYLYSFLAGMSVAMLITFLAWFDLIHYADVTATHLTPKTFHVVYNPLLAFAAYLAFHEAIWGQSGRRKPAVRAGLFSLAGLMSLNMFITEGRTGQAVFLVLMGLLLFQVFAKNRLRAVLAIALLLPSLCITGYLYSPTFQQRIDTAWLEIDGFEDNPDTSVGMRMLFFRNSLELIRHHPWLGVGTGDFQAAYAEVNRKRSPSSIATDNPHNQYVLVAVMLGMPGLLALLLIFAAMFIQAWLIPDKQQRIRFAFPLFFLVIMLAESYLTVYQTAFFFSLMAAVLYKKKPDQQMREFLAGAGEGVGAEENTGKRCWLILSYRANIEGSACSQHIDDRLPFFREQGIEPVLLTSTVGDRSDTWMHYRTPSLAPSGIRFELRHFLRKHLHKRWQFKVVETICMLPVFPLYLVEKIIINLESEWSWWCLASLRGFLLCRQLRPEVVYSTGGSASAHVAALLIKQWTGCTWIAETQDPLVHDHGWRRGGMVLRVYKTLEKKICSQADVFVFLVRAAMDHCRQRTGGMCNGAVVYPGSIPALFQQQYIKGDRCHFAHFGSLAGTRNLLVFFQALHQVLARYTGNTGDAGDAGLRNIKDIRNKVRVDLYGSFDGASEREMRRLDLQELVLCHGPVPRREALAAMQQTDCLLLIQNIIYFSCETIPSKVYEYLLAERPIIGLLHNNEELESMLKDNGHHAVPADDVQAVAAAIEQTLADFMKEEAGEQGVPAGTTVSADAGTAGSAGKIRTAADAVNELIRLSGCDRCS